jgi:hypothetical protein
MQYPGQNEDPNGMKCAEFDSRLADALDGIISGKELETFRAHAAACTDCGPLFTQAQSGMNLLKSLAEVEPPANLVHNVLARTSIIDPAMALSLAAVRSQGSWLARAREWAAPVLDPALNFMAQPRLAMTAAMAFFSISLLFNMAGLRMSDLKNLDLRPSAITTGASLRYNQTTARVVKYYENIRFVYELESRMKELKKDSGTSGDQDNNKNQKQQQRPDNNTSQKPETNTNENYSLEKAQEAMAVLKLEKIVEGQTAGQLMQDRRLS